MNEIYANAQITLIAAAGSDAEYGLPGVGLRSRDLQSKHQVGDISLVQVFPHSSHAVKSSKWATRGWTYQEGFLSPRRLLFTDQQVTYLCNKMCCAESVKQSLQLTSRILNKPFLGIIPGADSLAETVDTAKFLLASRHIEEYSMRQLSYDFDAMSAFLGILRSLENSREPIRHLWGLLLWKIPSNVVVAITLKWYHQSPCRRRPDFPSWSWTAWEGPVQLPRFDADVPRGFIHIEISKARPSVDIYDFLELDPISYQRPELENGRYLSFHGLAITLSSFEHVSWSKRQKSKVTLVQSGHTRKLFRLPRRSGLHAALALTPELTQLSFIFLDEEMALEDLNTDGILGVLIQPEGQDPKDNAGLGVMLLKYRGDCYQRVGFLRVKDWWDNPGKLPYTAYRSSSRGFLNEVTMEEISPTGPLWLKGATRKVIRVG
jgi:hypothetical protein